MLVKKDCKIWKGILFRRYTNNGFTNSCHLCRFEGTSTCLFLLNPSSNEAKRGGFSCRHFDTDLYIYVPERNVN